MNRRRQSSDRRSRRYSTVFFGLVAVCTILAFGAAAKVAETAATPILSAAEIDYPPFCIVDAQGRADGFAVELMRAALKAMNREVTFRVGPWAQVKGWLEGGEVQALPLVGRTPEREPVFDFSVPYMSLHGAIVVRTGTDDIRDLGDLPSKRVAVMKGDNAEEFLRRVNRGIALHTTATFQEALGALAEGRCDAVVIQRLVALRLIQETGLKNLRIINQPIEGFRQDFCFAVKEGDRDTLALLNEGLSLVMADGTYRHLHAKWFAVLELPSHRRIVIGGDHNYPPYEYLDANGRPAGYNVDLTRAIAQEVGLDIEIRLGPWSEIRDALARGEIDALQGLFYSPQRDLTLDFTPPHTVNHCVSVVRNGEGPPPTTMAELAGKRIVVQQGDIMHDWVRENRLGGQVSVVDAQEDALRELAAGRHDCALVSRMTAMYWIDKYGWRNLTVGNRPLLSPEYCYAVPNGHQALLAQLAEGLKVIDQTGAYRRIFEKWMGVYADSPASLVTIVRHVAMVAVPLLALLVGFFLWTWSLRQQVGLRTEQLRRSDELQRAMIACSPVALYSIGIDGRVLTWNASAEKLFGYTAAESIGQPLPIVPPDKQAEFADLRQRVIEGRSFLGLEVVRQNKNGALFDASLSAAPIHDAGGHIVGIMASIEDITARKQAEKALRQSEEQYRRLTDNTLDVIWTLNLDLEFTYVNPACFQLVGFTPAEFIGSRLPDHCDEENLAIMSRVIMNEMARGPESSGVTFEAEMLHKNGEPIAVEIHGKVIFDDDAQPVRLQGITRDISERRQAEQRRVSLENQLRQAQKMEAVGRLAGGVAHDYNNMLSVIIGYAEQAIEKVDPSATLHADLGEIITAARRSVDITRQLLAFARKQAIAPVVLDLNATVESMLRMLRRLIGEDIDLAWRPGAPLWSVSIDPSQLDQILANLCVNARDAIAGVGKITIETQNVRFDAAYCADHPGFVPGAFVLLAVSDDGCGMDKETRDNVFVPFFTTKGVGKGTGLGLATVYGIVKQNSGFVNVYSEPAKGTTIRIYLPRHAGDADRIGEESPAQVPLSRGETVLVVEDEASVLKLARRLLEGLGYAVLSAGTPGEAVGLVDEHAGRIDLLIADVIMPEMNGRDLAARVSTDQPAIKTLFMSGYTADVIAHRGVLDQGVNFLQKPFSRQELAAKVRAALDRQ